MFYLIVCFRSEFANFPDLIKNSDSPVSLHPHQILRFVTICGVVSSFFRSATTAFCSFSVLRLRTSPSCFVLCISNATSFLRFHFFLVIAMAVFAICLERRTVFVSVQHEYAFVGYHFDGTVFVVYFRLRRSMLVDVLALWHSDANLSVLGWLHTWRQLSFWCASSCVWVSSVITRLFLQVILS